MDQTWPDDFFLAYMPVLSAAVSEAENSGSDRTHVGHLMLALVQEPQIGAHLGGRLPPMADLRAILNQINWSTQADSPGEGPRAGAKAVTIIQSSEGYVPQPDREVNECLSTVGALGRAETTAVHLRLLRCALAANSHVGQALRDSGVDVEALMASLDGELF